MIALATTMRRSWITLFVTTRAAVVLSHVKFRIVRLLASWPAAPPGEAATAWVEATRVPVTSIHPRPMCRTGLHRRFETFYPEALRLRSTPRSYTEQKLRNAWTPTCADRFVISLRK